jgi:hypothetical protein
VKSGRSGVRFWSREHQLCFFGYFVFYWFIFVCQCAVAAAVMLVSSSDIWSDHILINLMLLYMIVGGVDRVHRTSPRRRRAEHLIFSANFLVFFFYEVKLCHRGTSYWYRTFDKYSPVSDRTRPKKDHKVENFE